MGESNIFGMGSPGYGFENLLSGDKNFMGDAINYSGAPMQAFQNGTNDIMKSASPFGMGMGSSAMGQQSNPWDFGNTLGNIGTIANIGSGIFGMINQNKGMNMAQQQMDRQHKMAQHQQGQRDASINSWK